MQLDHKDLGEPFEPDIRKLFDSAFGDALKGLAAVGLAPAEVWHSHAGFVFRAACLASFKETQIAVGKTVLDLERQIVIKEKEEAVARVKRDSSVTAITSVRVVLQNRQLVLRRLIDSMLWVLVWPNFWILRRLRVDGGIKRIVPETLEPLLEVVEKKRHERSEPLTIMCDLTTTAQLGDLIIAKWLPDRGTMKIVVAELKVGRMNILLRERLHRPEAVDLDAKIAAISEELGHHAGKQASRMARQQERLKNFEDIIGTDRGFDPLSGRSIRMSRKATVYKDYREKLATVLERAKTHGWCGLTLDRCLHIIAECSDDTPPERQGLKIAHAFYHLTHSGSCSITSARDAEFEAMKRAPMAVNLFDYPMRTSIAMPPLLWYPSDLMFDALGGRIKVYAQLDYEKFLELARQTANLKLNFITGRHARRIKADKQAPLIEFRDARFVSVEGSGSPTMCFGARFFGRVYTTLTRPLDLVRMLKESLEEISAYQSEDSSESNH